MKRWHDEQHIAKRRQKVAKQYHGWRANQAGRYRKKHPLDCGNTRCHVCHSDKLMGYEHEQETRSRASFKEQLAEL